MLRTHLHATLATDAFLLVVESGRARRYTLRVVAPHAMQWTTLHKEGRADARPIMDSKTLDVKQGYHPV